MRPRPLISGVTELGDWPEWAALTISVSRDDPFRPIKTLGFLNRDRFFEILNADRDLPQITFKPRLGGVLISGFIPRDQQGYRINAQLRMYIDEWLNTGRSKDGTEDPRLRDLTKAPTACWAIRHANREAPRLEPAPNGLNLRFPTESRQASIASAFEQQVDRANTLLTLFFLCEWRLRLAKCRRDDCGCYFELRKSHCTYKKGTFCPECTRARSLESARFSTAEVRKMAEAELYELIGKRFWRRIEQHPRWHEDQSLRKQIVGYVNARIERREDLKTVYRSGVRQGITEKWVAWKKNRLGVEYRVQAIAALRAIEAIAIGDRTRES